MKGSSGESEDLQGRRHGRRSCRPYCCPPWRGCRSRSVLGDDVQLADAACKRQTRRAVMTVLNGCIQGKRAYIITDTAWLKEDGYVVALGSKFIQGMAFPFLIDLPRSEKGREGERW